jgi:hypothetical protein
MDPTDLTCAHCGTSWKVIKADGPIACPNCKAVVGQAQPTTPPPEPSAPPAPPPSSPPPPAAVRAQAPTAAPLPRPSPNLTDADDPGIGAPPRVRIRAVEPPRRRRHPLVTVAVILGLIMLVPVALSVCLFAVCWVAYR